MAFFKKHLTSNYSEILYDAHAINTYDSLHQGSDESTTAYLHRVQDILKRIHHTSDMSPITTISTNHVKILTGLKDSQLQNKLAVKSKKMDYHGPGPAGCSRYGHWLWKVTWVFTPNIRHSICFIHKFYFLLHVQQATYKMHKTVNSNRETQVLALPGRTLKKGLAHSCQAKFPLKIQIHKGKTV